MLGKRPGGALTDLPWGVLFRMPDGRWVRCHPTQLYESLFHLTMAGGLLWLMVRGLVRTHRLQLYLIAYGSKAEAERAGEVVQAVHAQWS